MPFVLARENYLPPAFGEILEATATPWKAIVLCCVVFTLLVPLGFLALVVLDVFFYMAALVLEMLALLKLRRLRPNRDGLFVAGGGKVGLILIVTLPLVTWTATFGLAVSQGGAHIDFLIAIALGVTVMPAYAFARRRWGGPRDRIIAE
jgi:amino acid transporter